MNNNFRFKKGDLEIEFSGEKDYVEKQIEIWKNLLTKNINSSVEQSFSQSAVPKITLAEDLAIEVKKNISIEDFFVLKSPENNADKTLIAAYYLEKYDKYDCFSELDLYRLLNIVNVSEQIEINLKKNFICRKSKKNNLNYYTLTFSGEKYVKDGLYIS